MKKTLLIAVIALCIAGPSLAQERAPLKEKKDRISYVVGVDIGNTLKKQPMEIGMEKLFEGIKDALSGSKLLLTDEEMAQIKAATVQEMAEKETAKRKEAAEKNRAAEEKFLAENKSKEGVITLPSGLQYQVMAKGEDKGRLPGEEDQVRVNYKVVLLDGSVLEDSAAKGGPAIFILEDVIPGLREGIMKMQTGAKHRFFVPSKLAYGEEGAGELLGPNMMLIFDLELMGIVEKQAEKAAGAPQEKPGEDPADKAAGKPGDKPAEKPAEK